MTTGSDARADGYTVELRYGEWRGRVVAWITAPDGKQYATGGDTASAAKAAAERVINARKTGRAA